MLMCSWPKPKLSGYVGLQTLSATLRIECEGVSTALGSVSVIMWYSDSHVTHLLSHHAPWTEYKNLPILLGIRGFERSGRECSSLLRYQSF